MCLISSEIVKKTPLYLLIRYHLISIRVILIRETIRENFYAPYSGNRINRYLVSDGRNKYSVPYNLIGEKVDIRVTKTAVEVFYHSSCVASHRRLHTIQRESRINLEHMPLVSDV